MTETISQESSPSAQERKWAVITHLSSLVLFVGIPFGHLVGPAVVWLLKKDSLPSIDQHGKDCLNFQISMTVYMIVAGVLCFVLIGFPLLAALLIIDLVCTLKAAVEANKGLPYKYPFSFTFLT